MALYSWELACWEIAAAGMLTLAGGLSRSSDSKG